MSQPTDWEAALLDRVLFVITGKTHWPHFPTFPSGLSTVTLGTTQEAS